MKYINELSNNILIKDLKQKFGLMGKRAEIHNQNKIFTKKIVNNADIGIISGGILTHIENGNKGNLLLESNKELIHIENFNKIHGNI
ncbi:hypothetical protein PIROE2DRAFT_10379 [Piromyces sp. E2]|nr:hypothetical protein PIROE2DRAFT_10379 [Piromyces sp. E2]|eukprot:OUM63160.1 hypothetical protein PIROE2DRAFT_10379 [Piromyces sp. E2]